MSLLSFWKTNREQVLGQTIKQIVNNAGDGDLRDGSECEIELRQFLKEVPSEYLYRYASFCLENSFEDSGSVLQDLVNELGRRLGFVVENGRYKGVRNAIGFDGIWDSKGQSSIVVEVKTTTAYLMDVETFVGYKDRLVQEGRVQSSSSILIVVGRSDTGGLEAQVRGSKHSWDIRLISVDSLIKLVQVKEMSDDPRTVSRITEILRPFEYTRVDKIIDVIFTTAEDVDRDAVELVDEIPDSKKDQEQSSRKQEQTPREELEFKRVRAAEGFGKKLQIPLIKFSKTLFQSENGRIRICVAVSKKYDRVNQPYWYAFHPQWSDFLSEGEESYLILACMDRDEGFAIPYQTLSSVLPKLNQTKKENGRDYWHIALTNLGKSGLAINLTKVGEQLQLAEYEYRF